MQQDIYDFIVTGAGSAGAVVACTAFRIRPPPVLLLEAGPPDTNPWIHIPLGFRQDLHRPRGQLEVRKRAAADLDNRRLYLPRGKTLGGTSSINGMVYIRGNHADYDEWRQRGCVGWDWDSVLPYFRKAQNQARGRERISRHRWPAERLRPAVVGSNWPKRCWRPGAGRHPAQPRLQRRRPGGLRLLPDHHIEPAPLEHREGLPRPARSRPNLTIRTGAHATRVLTDRWPRDRRRIHDRRRAAEPRRHERK